MRVERSENCGRNSINTKLASNLVRRSDHKRVILLAATFTTAACNQYWLLLFQQTCITVNAYALASNRDFDIFSQFTIKIFNY